MEVVTETSGRTAPKKSQERRDHINSSAQRNDIQKITTLRDSKANPLEPLKYTPTKPRTPPGSTCSRSPNSANRQESISVKGAMNEIRQLPSLSTYPQQQCPSQQPYQQQQHNHGYHTNNYHQESIARTKTIIDPVVQQWQTRQLEFQQSPAKISSAGALDEAVEESSFMPSTAKSFANSSYHASSIGSPTTISSWSQSSSLNNNSGSISAYNSRQGSLNVPYRHVGPLHLSKEAQLLIDFNPGLLSTIAVAFRQKMLDNGSKRSELQSYGLKSPVAFTGKDAIDVVIELTQLDDRRHGLAIARSLENQFLFFGGGDNKLFDTNYGQYFFSDATTSYLPGWSEFPAVPRGVFPYSTKCYSYGCLPGDSTCYSYLCPNRQFIANAPRFRRQINDESNFGDIEKAWSNSVPASVVAGVSRNERNRQEAIFEVVDTEDNYIRDLELIEEIYIIPLRNGDIVDPGRVEEFIENVFLNYKEILRLHKPLLEALRDRQEEQPIVERIGDILMSHLVRFEEVYTRYSSRIILAEFFYRKEEAQNCRFAQFLRECNRHPMTRRLELRHFICQPYQRIPRYPLLLKEVIKWTDEGVPDRAVVEEVIKVCSELLKRFDLCYQEGNRRLRLLTIQDKITWRSKEEHRNLKLTERTRQLHFECIARLKTTFEMQTMDLRLLLFDHMLLMTKEKRDKQGDKDDFIYQVTRNPIPLELVNIWPEDGKSVSYSRLKSNPLTAWTVSDNDSTISSRVGFRDSWYTASVTVEHRGRRGGVYTLYMIPETRDEFIEQVNIVKQSRQDVVFRPHLFKINVITEISAHPPASVTVLSQTHPIDGKRVTCSAPYFNVLDGKRRIVLGTEDGIYVGMEDDKSSFRLAISDLNVTNISVLEDYHLLLILSGEVLKAVNISCLELNGDKSLQIGQQLGESVQYFTAGVCGGLTLVITMSKKGLVESCITAYQPIENAVLGGQYLGKISIGKSMPKWFRLYREFYVTREPSHLIMLPKMVCAVCPSGFEILMLERLVDTRVFPTPKDPEYAFLLKRPESVPISMFKINSDSFLMCYSDFAFTMYKNGNLVKKELIEFEGRAQSFTMVYPYIIAIESGLIEIRHIETGALEQLIFGDNIRLLYADVDIIGNAVIHIHMSDRTRGDIRQIVKLVKAAPKLILKTSDNMTKLLVILYGHRHHCPSGNNRQLSL
ncbi:RHO1 GDP-GTP exchange protein 2 [Lunasporangiospora selenospora]|uniref:RHO1 GDP-GTP exchange protein 2 n=1 Tax=Lunasporangiospora selenospora TaxID=979761 RepID=A0A9P6KGV6_9FUNG|nr:RHO1 GDP-GTP exchange protein 2 [Lunasporangiospora selenospora]